LAEATTAQGILQGLPTDGRQEKVVGKRSAGRWIGLSGSAAALLALLSGCSVGDTFHGFGWPEGVTTQSHKMYDLWVAAVVAALIVGVVVWGLMVWCIVKYRKRGDELPVQTRFNLPIELLYTVLPFLIIAVLFYYTAIVETDVNRQSKSPDVTVQVVAFKWNWEFDYQDGPTMDGRVGKTVTSTVGASDYIPVLVLPVGKKIRFEETSRDVIHSFWVPELLFKRDVFPGNVRNTFEVTVVKEGHYVGRCAELCGTYHSMMNFEVRAVSWDNYQKFLAAKIGGMSTPQALAAIGEAPLATTTCPFNTDRENRVATDCDAKE
jgi:cytochrome c oxidase subunit 2